jgi:hypothetical protein
MANNLLHLEHCPCVTDMTVPVQGFLDRAVPHMPSVSARNAQLLNRCGRCIARRIDSEAHPPPSPPPNPFPAAAGIGIVDSDKTKVHLSFKSIQITCPTLTCSVDLSRRQLHVLSHIHSHTALAIRKGVEEKRITANLSKVH